MSSDKMETEEGADAEQTQPAEEPTTTTPRESALSSRSSKKRPRSPESTEVAVTTAAVSAASAAAAAQLSATMGWNGLYQLLSASAMGNANSMPTLDQVQQAASKCIHECPPLVHLSKTDSAPQLKTVDDRRLECKGGMRGYRMTRATHGASSGSYYYEVLVLEPPSVSEIAASLPPNVRMGKKLQAQMQQALEEEKQGKEKTSVFGGHIRLGWSMRTGDLQAPVGYDKWSFAVRDIGGAKIHKSRREDHWGGEGFGPGDVVGCAISFSQEDSSEGGENHIRFFKNGVPMGEFVISKGKREGGVAFVIPDGVYYPAISLYMGAHVRFNPGPHFVYPPKKLPTGLKLQPVSDLSKTPMAVDEAVTKVQKEKTFRKPDMLHKFQALVSAEVEALEDFYQTHRKKHVQEVFQEREKRNLATTDLEEDEYFVEEIEKEDTESQEGT